MLHERVDKFLKNPKKALITLSLPMLIGMFVQTLYNIVDTAFVGRLGVEAIAALTFAFPVFFIFIAINNGLGSGINSRISRFLGEKNIKQAENTAMHGIYISIVLAVIISALGIIFIKPIFSLLGASGQTLELSIEYMKILFYSMIFFFIFSVINNIYVSQGDTKTAMILQVIALGINMILDPIFIYTLKLGVRGAAIATAISISIGLLISLILLSKRSLLKIHTSSFKFSKKILKDIVQIGFPGILMMLTMSISFMIINKIISIFGVEYTASVGLAFRLESLATMPLVAIALSMLTLTGMIYGAKRYELLKIVSLYSMKISIIISLVMGFFLFFYSSILFRIFTDNIQLISLATHYMKINIFAYPTMAIILILSRMLQGMGKGFSSLILNTLRTLIIPIPLSILLIYKFSYGYLAIPLSVIIGGIISSLIGLIWINLEINKLNIKEKLI